MKDYEQLASELFERRDVYNEKKKKIRKKAEKAAAVLGCLAAALLITFVIRGGAEPVVTDGTESDKSVQSGTNQGKKSPSGEPIKDTTHTIWRYHGEILPDDYRSNDVYVNKSKLGNIVAFSEETGWCRCSSHRRLYHSYPGFLEEYVGKGAFDRWIDEESYGRVDPTRGFAEDECGLPYANIYEFVRYFSIPKSIFVNGINSQRYLVDDDYDIDLLFNGSAEDNEKEYNVGSYDNGAGALVPNEPRDWKKMNFTNIKGYVETMMGGSLPAVNGVSGMDRIIQEDMSLPELVYYLGLTREEFETIIREHKERYDDENWKDHYDYDIGLIYDRPDELLKLANEHTGLYVDLLFCGLEPREYWYDTPIAPEDYNAWVYFEDGSWKGYNRGMELFENELQLSGNIVSMTFRKAGDEAATPIIDAETIDVFFTGLYRGYFRNIGDGSSDAGSELGRAELKKKDGETVALIVREGGYVSWDGLPQIGVRIEVSDLLAEFFPASS